MLQQKPSVQKVLAHSLPCVHVWPLAPRHALMLHVAPAAQSPSPEQVVRQLPPGPHEKWPAQADSQQILPPCPSSTHAPLEHSLPEVHGVPFFFVPVVMPPLPLAVCVPESADPPVPLGLPSF